MKIQAEKTEHSEFILMINTDGNFVKDSAVIDKYITDNTVPEDSEVVKLRGLNDTKSPDGQYGKFLLLYKAENHRSLDPSVGIGTPGKDHRWKSKTVKNYIQFVLGRWSGYSLI